jgi:photosystem II stability/assembly factor-like uncharacterized protein
MSLPLSSGLSNPLTIDSMPHRTSIYRPLAVVALVAAAACTIVRAPAPEGAGRWMMQASGTTASFRGVSAVDENVAWASGSAGTYLRTTDGGATWRADTVLGMTGVEFRDVQAFDADRAVLLTAGQPARIYLTEDGGRQWRVAFQAADTAAFFDGLAFWNEREGIAFSDPVGGRFLIVTTADGGRSWTPVPRDRSPAALPGEAAFAASGTAVAVHGTGSAWIVTGGGAVSRVLRTVDRGRTWAIDTLPIPAGNSSSGAFGVAFRDAAHGVVVGGDYRQEQVGGAAARTADGGRTWTPAASFRPAGVREGAAYVPGTGTLVAVGPAGTLWSRDDGASWMAADTVGFHAVSFAGPRAGWAVGAGGRVAWWTGAIPRGR